MASRSHRSSSSGRRRTAVVAATVAAAVALVAALIVAFGPDDKTDAGPVAATPVSGTRATPTPTATPTPKTPGAKTTTPSPTASARKSSPPPAATPHPSATAASAPPRKASGAAPLAGRIKPGVSYDGVATFYDTGNGDGACLYGPTADVMTAAMNHTDYETSKACGAYILVHAASGASVTVRITNECPLPCAPGQLDLSPQAFAKLAAPVQGRIPVTWTLLSPSISDTISIRYKTGSTRYWCAVQAIGHRNPLARLEVETAAGWSALPRTDYNYFLSEQGSGCGGTIRITDIYGEQLEIAGLGVKPDVVQPTRVQFARH